MRECWETHIKAVDDDCSLCSYSELCCRQDSEPDLLFRWHEEGGNTIDDELSGGN